jgi:hypothetical protein
MNLPSPPLLLVNDKRVPFPNNLEKNVTTLPSMKTHKDTADNFVTVGSALTG